MRLTYADFMARARKRFLLRAIRACGGNVAMAAEEIKVNRTALYHMLERDGIEPPRTGSGRRGCWEGCV